MPAEIKDMLPDIFGKDLQQTGNLANFNEPRLNYISILDTVQDFLWKLAIKPMEKNIFSLNDIIVGLTKIINNFNEPDIFGKDLQQTGNLANFNELQLN